MPTLQSYEFVRLRHSTVRAWTKENNVEIPIMFERTQRYMNDVFGWSDCRTFLDADDPMEYIVVSRKVTIHSKELVTPTISISPCR